MSERQKELLIDGGSEEMRSFMYACESNDVDQKKKWRKGWSGLDIASFYGSAEAIESLVAECGANVDDRNVCGRNAVHLAVYGDRNNAIRALCKLGANMNARGMLQRTPLHWCASYNVPECAAALVECRADRSCIDSHGETPAQLARRLQHYDVAKILEDPQ